ncbi:MAG: hypothetical protein KJ698_07970 [Actinobacteria bacterium]|nr:hypothetical protein [Actinomycetota bacterium]MBU1492410.1 hypothetical protein [Actinomycetota bacterium]MBU1866278.1 hypothetical protein [Actinomycetota bacterium]
MSAAVVPALAGFDVDVSNAVAPFDHESNVDSLLLEFGVARVRNQQVFDCIAAAGFVPPTTTALPDRDDPMLRSAAFPDVETLAREGFPNLPGTPGTLGPEDTRSEAEAAASRACAEQVDGSQTDVIEAIGLFGSMRSAWEEVLAEIDALEATHSLVDEFGACLREEGIPAEFTTSEGHYLGYVDSLLATGSDQSTRPEIRQRMGRLYADCGQDLFAARSALRSGERRETFLSQHQDSISRLSALLLGLDQPPDTPTGATSTTIAAVGDAELLACMVGGWQFDTAAFEVELQNHEDPSGIYLLIDYVSGGGSLVVRADGTFTLGYDDLTYLIEAPTSGGTVEDLVTVSGEVNGEFTLDGDVFLAGEVSDPVLVVTRVFEGQDLGELPPAFSYRSLRMGTRANHPYYLEKITIGCTGTQLMVNDVVRIDTLTGDGPSTVWSRASEG